MYTIWMDDIPEQYFKIYITKHYFVFNFNTHDFMWSAKAADRRKGSVLFNDTLNTLYLRLYGVRHG